MRGGEWRVLIVTLLTVPLPTLLYASCSVKLSIVIVHSVSCFLPNFRFMNLLTTANNGADEAKIGRAKWKHHSITLLLFSSF